MAHCILLEKGTSNIIHYIENCIKTGRDFVGSNTVIQGVKESAYDEKWIAETINQEELKIGTITKKSALLFQDIPISSTSDVVVVVERKIRELYSVEEELKILRYRAIGNKNYQADYETNINTLIQAGETFIKLNSL